MIISRSNYINILTLFLLAPFMLCAQKAERRNIREGNRQYNKEKYTESEISYRKALEVNPKSSIGNYNLGNSLYKQKKPKEALERYQTSLANEKNPIRKSAVFHNAGNSFMQGKDYSDAVEAYKNSLRLNPSDDQTRYNLAVAQALLKKQQQQQKQQKQDKKENKNKDKKDKQKQQSQKDQQKQQQQHKQQQQKQQEEVSKEKARQLLDALMQDEKDTQEKVRKLQMQRGRAKKTEKDW